MYSVNQPWDPLKVCVVGASYPPEFYSFITNSRVRHVMERIATETEEDYQLVIKKLQEFNVQVVRPTISGNYRDYLFGGRLVPPPMTPRDYMASISTNFYIDTDTTLRAWDDIRGDSWPDKPDSVDKIPKHILEEAHQMTGSSIRHSFYKPVIDLVAAQGNPIIYNKRVNTADVSRIGRDLYFGTETYKDDLGNIQERNSELFPDYRCHVINTGGHSDGTYCPVKPGLIVSLKDVSNYSQTFPGWEVVYLPYQSWARVRSFLDLKEKNAGKWWVPGEELNDDFTNFVESWLGHWVGYVEETVFDVNMLVIDEKNVICNNHNDQVFEAFNRHGITPHVINFRHRYFWDGGLHCITADLDRTGGINNYFPERS